jgi:hypothetical protein
MLVLVLTSHPFAVLASQLPHPLAQALNVQVPVEHDAVALGNEHDTPQPPQSVNVFVPVSQPLFGFASQLEKPPAHTGVHTPFPQLVVPLAFVHVIPHEPQSVTVARLVSHPLSAFPSQFAQPASHVIEQTVFWHDGVPWMALHCLPHTPQFATAVCRFVSQPLDVCVSQSPKLAMQERPQTPALHVVVAFAPAGHALPQEPQLWAEESSAVSQPFAATLSQSA